MRVTIDGTEYVAVTAKMITVDGVVYAELAPSVPGHIAGQPKKIIDNDGDAWVPDSENPGLYRCPTTPHLQGRTRDEIESMWGITREEF